MTFPAPRRPFTIVLASAAMIVGLCAGCATDPATTNAQPTPVPSTQFDGLEVRYGARLGVSAVDLNSGQRADYRSDERFAFSSTFKAYAVGAVLAAVDAGTIALSDTRTVTAADKVPASAVDWPVDSVVTLGDLAAAALTKSDNTSGNLLIDAAGGTSAVTEFAHRLGDNDFRLDRTEPDLNTAIPGDVRDTTTPAGLAAGYRTLLDGDALNAASRQQLIDWMAATETSTARFRAALPASWTSADKTGTGRYGVSNDAGLLLGPNGERILVIVLTTTVDGGPDAPAMNELVAEATRRALDGVEK